jgi:Tol biopolymer transport system component
VTVTAPPRPPRPDDPVSHAEVEALVEALIEEARQRARRRRRRNAAIVILVALAGVVLFALLGTGGAGGGPAVAPGTQHPSASPPKVALPEELSFSANGSVVLLRRDGRRLPFLSGILQPRGHRQHHLHQGLEWSPDGSKLLAMRWGYGERALEVTDETGKVVWTVYPHASSGSWSPDGTRIAFIHPEPRLGGSGFPALVVASIDGHLLTRIAGHLGWVNGFSWSPDGTKLAYAAQGFHPHRLMIADATGRRPPRRVPIPTGAGAPGPRLGSVEWSPNGSLIAFVSGDDVGTHVYVVHPDGGSLRRVADGGPFLTGLGPPGTLDWSPGGKRLAIVAPTGPRSADISVVNADGTDLHRIARCRCDLTVVGFDQSVAWSLDGTRIAYINGRGNTISTARPDGSGATVVATVSNRVIHLYPSALMWRPTRAH